MKKKFLIKEKFIKLSQKISYFQIRLLLALLYVFVISPIAVIWKVIRKDPLSRKIDKNSKSYYVYYQNADIDIKNLAKPY